MEKLHLIEENLFDTAGILLMAVKIGFEQS